MKTWVENNPVLKFLYNRIYLRYVLKIRRNVRIEDYGRGNIVCIPYDTLCDDLHIKFIGNHNMVKIGSGCKLCKTNTIYIQNDGNKVIIGDNVTFDQDVSIVIGENTTCEIGSECLLAKGVRIRTCDQHFIYDESGNRINRSQNVRIGNHVWLGASVIIMKGATVHSGSVIGMDSMVIKDIPENSVAVGKPAKVVRTGIHWKEY